MLVLSYTSCENVNTGKTLGCCHCTCPERCAPSVLVSRTLGISATVEVSHAESIKALVLRGNSYLWLLIFVHSMESLTVQTPGVGKSRHWTVSTGET